MNFMFTVGSGFTTAAGGAGIAFDAATQVQTEGPLATDITFSHTCTGSDLVLLVGIGSTAGVTINTVTYNGVGMTRIGAQLNYNTIQDWDMSFWYLLDPATGAHDVVATASGDTSLSGCAVSYTGVGAVDTAGEQRDTETNAAAISVAVGSASGELVVDLCACYWDSITPHVSQTSRVTSSPETAGFPTLAMSEEAGAASVTMSWTATNTELGLIAVALEPA